MTDQQSIACIVAAILASSGAESSAQPEAAVKRYRDILRELRKGGGPTNVPPLDE